MVGFSEGLTALESSAHSSCAQLRFAEGLRRRWEEGRAESAVQEASVISWIEGARGSVTELRELTMLIDSSDFSLEQLDAGLYVMLGVWRGAWQVEQNLPALNSRTQKSFGMKPPAAVLAALNRDVCSFLSASKRIPTDKVAVPKNPQSLQRVLSLANSQSETATSRVAGVLQTMLQAELFEFGNLPTAFLFSKWMLARDGVEPTAVSVFSEYAGQNQQKLSELIGTGNTEEWHEFVLLSLIQGCEAGKMIATSVQAGVTVPNQADRH